MLYCLLTVLGRSQNLIGIAKRHQPHSSIVADSLSLPHPSASFDFVISIAVVHHLSTDARRVEAVSAILDVLKPTSKGFDRHCTDFGAQPRALIYVWALEQKHSRRGWDEGDDQDVMVPWVTKQCGTGDMKEPRTFNRYYHLYRRGELEGDIETAGGEVVESGYEKDNWWAIAVRRTPS